MMNSFLAGNDLFLSLTKKCRAKSEGNITEYCNVEMPSSKPIHQVHVSMCTVKTSELWFTEWSPSAVTQWYKCCCLAPPVPKGTLLPWLSFFLPCFTPAPSTFFLCLPAFSDYCLKTLLNPCSCSHLWLWAMIAAWSFIVYMYIYVTGRWCQLLTYHCEAHASLWPSSYLMRKLFCLTWK